MKEKVMAVCLLVLVLLFVIFNTIMLDRHIVTLVEAIENGGLDEEKASIAYDIFRQKKMFMSFSVSHEDLTSIEECFITLGDYIKDGDEDNAEITKNRLVFYLEHLRRLSGFNMDSII